MDQCEIEDNWHTLGMRGTGVDVHLGGVEIPALNFIRATDKPVANEHYKDTVPLSLENRFRNLCR